MKKVTKNFTKVPNELVLSMEAGAVVLWMRLSHYESLTRHLKNGEAAFPGQDKLAEELGVHKSTIKRHTKALEKAGWITVTRRGKRLPNLYRVHEEPVAVTLAALSEGPSVDSHLPESEVPSVSPHQSEGPSEVHSEGPPVNPMRDHPRSPNKTEHTKTDSNKTEPTTEGRTMTKGEGIIEAMGEIGWLSWEEIVDEYEVTEDFESEPSRTTSTPLVIEHGHEAPTKSDASYNEALEFVTKRIADEDEARRVARLVANSVERGNTVEEAYEGLVEWGVVPA